MSVGISGLRRQAASKAVDSSDASVAKTALTETTDVYKSIAMRIRPFPLAFVSLCVRRDGLAGL
jgi:hypothetical protein